MWRFPSSTRLSSLHRSISAPLVPHTCAALKQAHVPQHRPSSTAVKKSSGSYSYVIVGAGSAGCVLANRLSENPAESVLLLEAGPKDKHLGSTRLSWKIHMPAALTYNLCDDRYNWFYHTLPQAHMEDRVMYWPRGRVWGGSSSLNAMVYIRGHAEDYNRWQTQGAEGWDYDHCLPYFRKAQTHELGPDRYRGGDGPLHVTRGKTDHPLHHAFISAGQQAGYPYTADMNGFQQEGVGWMDMTVHRAKFSYRADAKKALQRMYFLRQLKKFNLPKTMMVQFYSAIIESILTSSIITWYAAATAKDKSRLQRIIRTAEKVIGCNLPSLDDLYSSRALGRAKKIVADPSHPGYSLFQLLPSGRRLRAVRTITSRHKNSFFPSAIGLFNKAWSSH